ncbi:hypothetical protein [Haploplasma axanthum]|uniref:hypothetical protein n=1 Tax=Haploplasma axanthum TaxID=29552 RepID=UPI0013C31033|nr:hypothetical protein [Haploplasma axanthum]
MKLEYSSSDEDVAYFEEVNGKVIFRTKNIGKTKITIKGIDGVNIFSEVIEIEVKEKREVNLITIADAITKPDDQKVYLEGIVGASLVNKTGFYLIDETGVIAVETTSDELSKIKLGNKVVIEGIKTHVGKTYDKNTNELTAVGQIVVKEAVLVVNEGGAHEYSTTSFKIGKTLKDFLNLNKLEDHSTEVYLITAKVIYEETNFYTRYSLEDNDQNRISVYSSSGKQLSFLDNYRDVEVEIEFTVVNWNGKNYVGSIIAIVVEGEKIVNNSNFK